MLETSQVAGTERRLQAARVRKKMRNLSGLESSAITTWTPMVIITIYIDTEVWTLTALRTPRAPYEKDSARPMQPRTK